MCVDSKFIRMDIFYLKRKVKKQDEIIAKLKAEIKQMGVFCADYEILINEEIEKRQRAESNLIRLKQQSKVIDIDREMLM